MEITDSQPNNTIQVSYCYGVDRNTLSRLMNDHLVYQLQTENPISFSEFVAGRRVEVLFL